MKTGLFSKCAMGCFMFAVFALAPAISFAAIFDATGNWNYQNTNVQTNCVTEPDYPDTGTVTIEQTGNSFTLNDSGHVVNGTVSGTRYQTVESGTDNVGNWSGTRIWNLSSPILSWGYMNRNYTNGCSYTADVYAEKETKYDCDPSYAKMCLLEGRFSVSVTWKSQTGQTGIGNSVPITENSGLFWFFSSKNMELLVKVLNGCKNNNYYWVFFAGTTDQQFEVTVTDNESGQSVKYLNPLKNPADAVTDTTAFATCP